MPYYSRPRQCVQWTAASVPQIWHFRLNRLVDINYIQMVLYSSKHSEEAFGGNVSAFRLVVSGDETAEDSTCRLLRHQSKRHYLTLEFSCASEQTINQRVRSISLSYESQQLGTKFSISLCELRVYRLPEDCGSPDLSLSVEAVNHSRNQYTFHCLDKNFVIEGKYFLTMRSRVYIDSVLAPSTLLNLVSIVRTIVDGKNSEIFIAENLFDSGNF